MAQAYLVECYWPGVDERRVEKAVAKLERTRDLAGAVSWVESVLIPEDEIVFCVFEAPSADAVRASADRAGLPAERIVTCVQLPTQTARNGDG
jgi:hypothetical protein